MPNRIALVVLALTLIPTAFAQTERSDRPRVGLVLSGGGARGAAHVGVLKVLEDLRVPIDAIAGTSMGAVVGGLYASGLTPGEIEAIMTSTSFRQAFSDRPPRSHLSFRRKQEDFNFLVKFPLGLRGGRFLLPKGLIQGQALHDILRRVTAPVATVKDFDKLPTPFRAVATDLETGDAVVLGTGDLTTAMRASLSAPGVFSPVERNGQLLVDGGIASNLPIDVARGMDQVDVLIVVDVGFPLLERDRLGSVPIISTQMLAILIRRDSRRQRATLGAKDIIIDPPLGDSSSFDFSRLERAIESGMHAAADASARLQALSLPPDAYERYVAQRADARNAAPQIDFLRVEPGSERYARAIELRFANAVGKPLDAERLGDRIRLLYGQGNLETLDYRVVEADDSYGLAFTARRNSWGPNYVRFGLNLQDDFEGSSSYNAAARFVLAEITGAGGEWVWDLQIGENPRIATEVYLPLSQGAGPFVMPHAQLGARNLVVRELDQSIAELRVRTFDYGLDIGHEFGNWGEIRAGYGRAEGVTRVRVGDPTLPTGEFDADEYFSRFSYDKLDDVNFPRHGQALTLEWAGQHFDVGSVRNSERLRFDWLMARSWGRQTAVLWTSAGTTIDDATSDVRSLFSLGGFLNLSGLHPESLTAPHFGIVRGLVYRQIGRGGPGVFDVPAYLGVSYEVGNVWNDRDEAGWGSARKDGSLFVGLDSLLGPVYLAVGFDEGGDEAFYLFLGRTF